MTFEELKDYLIECCKNGVTISYDSLKKEINDNPKEFNKLNLPDVTRKWRSTNRTFVNIKGKKAEYIFQDVYCLELAKTDHNSEDYVITAYIVPVNDENTREIHVLGVTKHPWSYEMTALNNDQYKKYSYKVQRDKTVTYRR